MTKFIAQLNDTSYTNTPADRTIKEENMIYAYKGGELVAAVDVSVVLAVHLSEKEEK